MNPNNKIRNRRLMAFAEIFNSCLTEEERETFFTLLRGHMDEKGIRIDESFENFSDAGEPAAYGCAISCDICGEPYLFDGVAGLCIKHRIKGVQA